MSGLLSNHLSNQKQILDYLKKLGKTQDQDIDLFESCLVLSALDHPGISLDRYRNYFRKLTQAVKDRYDYLQQSGHEQSIEVRLAAMRDVLISDQGYAGDSEDYHAIENTDLIRVIDRRKGMPIMLCLLYISIGRELGWAVDGLSIPGHFVARMDQNGNRIIFDPFHDCKILEAPDLRQLVKSVLGPHAELSASYYEPAENRSVLIRIQNNKKISLIKDEDYQKASEVVDNMRLIAPDDYRLLFDAGILYARIGSVTAAREALEKYIDMAPNNGDKQDAVMLLDEINRSLN